MTAEPFNREGMWRALAPWRTAWNHFLDEFGGTLLKALAQIAPEGRRKLIADCSVSGPRLFTR